MGILRYVVQGFGWEVGRSAARGAIDEVKDQLDEAKREDEAERRESRSPSPRESRKLEAARRREEARKRAEIEAELRRLEKARRDR